MDNQKKIDYSTIIPAITGTLIISGVTRLIVYYSAFSINILDYLEFDEIITSFFDIIIPLILFLSMLLLLLVRAGLLQLIGHDSKPAITNKRKSFIAIAAILAIPLIIGIYKYELPIKFTIFFFAFQLIAQFAIMIFCYQVYVNYKTPTIKHLCITTVVLLSTLSLVISLSTIARNEIYSDHKRTKTTIIFNNEVSLKDSSHVITTDSLTYYVGKTKNYVFVYNSKTASTLVVPISNVLQIEIKQISAKFGTEAVRY